MSGYLYIDKGKVNDEVKIEDFKAALRIITNAGLIIDAEHINLIAAAETGLLAAIYELAQAFHQGNVKGIPQNYLMARLYVDYLIENCDGPLSTVNCLKNSGLLERDLGNPEKAKEELIKAAKVQSHNVELKDWDYSIYDYLRQLTVGQID